MDIRLLIRVLVRFKYLAIAAVLVAGLAMTFSIARLDPSSMKLEYREKLQYTSTSVLLVDGNQPSWLYAVPPDGSGDPAVPSDAASGSIADPARLGGLTSLYGFFVRSDAVRKLTGDDPVNSVVTETITADAGNGNREPLPLLAIIATAGSPRAATDLAGRATTAFQRYLVTRQADAQVLPSDRVTLRVVNAPSDAELVAPRSYTRAVVAGLMTLIAAIGLMLLIENLRPAVGPARPRFEDDAPPPPPPTPTAKPEPQKTSASKPRRRSRDRATGAAATASLAVKAKPVGTGSPHPEAPTA
jgi:hypothetical protein